MSAFGDVGRMMIEACVTASLGPLADVVDVPSAVVAYVEKWGFVDIDEVPQDEYWKLVRQYVRPTSL